MRSSICVLIVSSNGTVNLIDLIQLTRNRLQNLVRRIQFIRQLNLLRSQQRIFIADARTECLLLGAVLLLSEIDRAIRRLRSQIVQRRSQRLAKAARVLQKSSNVREAGVERRVQRVRIQRQRSVVVQPDPQLRNIRDRPTCRSTKKRPCDLALNQRKRRIPK